MLGVTTVKPTRYATLPDMNCATEKDRGTTGRGRADGPNRSNHLGRTGCVHGPSHPDAKCVSLPAIRTVDACSPAGTRVSRATGAWCLPGESVVRSARRGLSSHREGGRRLRPQAETVCPQVRGTGPRAARPYEGGPTGTTDLVCGAGWLV